jgi:SAM-dependent methyltransferase
MKAHDKIYSLGSSLYLWELEYLYQGIPSSFRSGPSGFLKDFLLYLKEVSSLEQKHCLDLGCGRGRNTFFLARQGLEVTCIDFIQANVDYIQSVAAIESSSISPLCSDITQPLPLEDNSVDYAVDIFCYKHQISLTDRQFYRMELSRVIKPRGYLFVSLAAVDDGFYGPLLQCSSDGSSNIVIDPFSNFASVIFSEAQFTEEFSDRFQLVKLWNKRKEGMMHGKCYKRSSLGGIFQLKESL